MPDITTSNLADELSKTKLRVAVGTVIDTVSTTAALAAIGNAINTTGKYKGKQVFNETTGILVIAADSSANSVWKNAGTGAAAHTPA
jgi:hypothetical protein